MRKILTDFGDAKAAKGNNRILNKGPGNFQIRKLLEKKKPVVVRVKELIEFICAHSWG